MAKVSNIYKRAKGTTRVSQLLILISFLVTFLISRLTVQLGASLELPSPNVINGLHIHHLVPGIFLILLSGYLGIAYWRNRKLRFLMAILFGTGAALTIDEFALWLHLRDVYWAKEGRLSVDTVIIISILLLIAFALSERHDHREFKGFLRGFFREKRT